MPPNLDTMFNRSANLSTRRPLLPEHQNLPIVERCPKYVAVPVATYRQYPDAYDHCSFDTFRPNYEYSRLDYGNNIPNNQKYGYLTAHSTPHFTYQRNKLQSDLNIDRREAELVFKFDTHSADELNCKGHHKYSKGVSSSASVNTASTEYCDSPNASTRAPDKDGPFVFGVHSPSQFNIPAASPSRDINCRVEDRTVISDDVSNKVECCDRTKSKTKKCLSRVFQIKGSKSVDKKDKIKCVLVGDGAVGKSSLIRAYAQNKFSYEYEPTAYDKFDVEVEVDNRPISVEICDTAGQDHMSELRSLCYPGTDVLMLCFSVVKPETFRSVGNRWIKAIYSIKAPLLLVGTQADCVNDPEILKQLALRGEHVVTESEARQLASAINAQYIETSSKTRKNLKDAFDAAILAGLPVVKKRKPLWKYLICCK